MTHIARTLAFAVALASSGMAKAEIGYVGLLVRGDPVGQYGWELANLQGSSTLSFSDALSGAMKYSGIAVSALDGTTVIEDQDTGNFVANLPLLGFYPRFDSDDMTFSFPDIRAMSGILLTAPGTLPNGLQNAATTGGSLQIFDLRARFEDRAVYATVVGTNGVGSASHFKLWNFANVEGDTSASLVAGPANLDIRVSGLTFTPEARDLFKQALGLTSPDGILFSPMSDLDAGMLSFTATFDVTGPIPEPSTYALMGLGLIGLRILTRKSRTRQKSSF